MPTFSVPTWEGIGCLTVITIDHSARHMASHSNRITHILAIIQLCITFILLTDRRITDCICLNPVQCPLARCTISNLLMG